MRKFLKKCWDKAKSFFKKTVDVLVVQIQEPFSFLKVVATGIAGFFYGYASAYIAMLGAIFIAMTTGSALLTAFAFILVYSAFLCLGFKMMMIYFDMAELYYEKGNLDIQRHKFNSTFNLHPTTGSQLLV